MTSPLLTMMTTIKQAGSLLFITLFLISAADCLYGQRKDFQSWYEVELDRGFKNGLGLSAEIEQRFRNNSSRYDRSLVTIAAEYDFGDYLSAAAGARMLMASDREMNIQPRYRFHADGTGRYALSELDLSFRVRLQYGFEDFMYLTDFQQDNLMGRFRIKAAYHLFGTRIDVFTLAESWGLFSSADGRFFKQLRYSAGASYSLSFRSELGLRYILEDEFNQVNPLRSHILVLGFAYSL